MREARLGGLFRPDCCGTPDVAVGPVIKAPSGAFLLWAGYAARMEMICAPVNL